MQTSPQIDAVPARQPLIRANNLRPKTGWGWGTQFVKSPAGRPQGTRPADRQAPALISGQEPGHGGACPLFGPRRACRGAAASQGEAERYVFSLLVLGGCLSVEWKPRKAPILPAQLVLHQPHTRAQPSGAERWGGRGSPPSCHLWLPPSCPPACCRCSPPSSAFLLLKAHGKWPPGLHSRKGRTWGWICRDCMGRGAPSLGPSFEMQPQGLGHGSRGVCAEGGPAARFDTVT